jgi:hypothetical protein
MRALVRAAYGCAVKHTAAAGVRREHNKRNHLRGVETVKESHKPAFVTEVNRQS